MNSRRFGRLRSTPLLAASAVLHGAGAITVAAAPQSAPMVLGAIVANHLVIGTAGLFPRSRWLGPNLTRLPPAAIDRRTLALTFDDGPDPEVTPQVIEMLASAGLRATFFCIGERAVAHPDLIAGMQAAGHGIENHSLTHPNGFALRGPRGMRREVEGAQTAIAESGGGTPRFFRPPAGVQNPFLHSVLAGAGLSLVSWTRRGFDTVSRDGRKVAKRLVGPGLAAGDILLLHDRTSAGGRSATLEALPRVIDEMRRLDLRSEALHCVLAPRPAV